MRTRLSAFLLIGLCLGLANCRPPNQTSTGCESDTDCTDPDKSHCIQGVGECVQCELDEHCGCHEVCENQQCVPYGANLIESNNKPGYLLNAHGRWQGNDPDSLDYFYNGLCEIDTDCPGIGQLCNPLTKGCVSAADFPPCFDITDECDPGPNGERTVCSEASDGLRCLPTALCRMDYNCCGDSQLICDEAAGLCLPLGQECTPPTPQELETTCPMTPRLSDECAFGFCNTVGYCVECTCDSDCADGLQCYPLDNRCRPDTYCTVANECELGDSCDVTANTCVPRCNGDDDCESGRYCRGLDSVCRPISERPCTDDAWESNDTAAEATAADNPLTLPALDSSHELSGFSFCINDEDWYILRANAGDHIAVNGLSIDGFIADIAVYTPGGTFELDDNTFGTSFGGPVEFTANEDGDYLLRVSSDQESNRGYYDLFITRTAGVICADAFELSEGRNDSPETATVLYDFEDESTAPGDCEIATTDSTATVTCTGIMRLCSGDPDLFIVRAASGTTFEAVVSGMSSDIDLKLYGPFATPGDIIVDSSHQIDSSGRGGTQDESVGASVRPEAYYVINPYLFNNAPESGYNITLTLERPSEICVEDVYDDPLTAGDGLSLPTPTAVFDDVGLNDLGATATGVSLLPGSQTLTLTGPATDTLRICAADTDWFRLGQVNGDGILDWVPSGHQLVVEATSVSSSAEANLSLAIGASPGLIADGSTNPASNARRVVVPVTQVSNFYYVSVNGEAVNGAPIDYDLQITLIEPPTCGEDGLGDLAASNNDAPGVATLLEPGGSHDWPDQAYESYVYEATSAPLLSLCGNNDDWYSINVPAGHRIVAWVQYGDVPEDEGIEVGLYLYDDSVGTMDGADEPTAGVMPLQGRLTYSSRADKGFQHVMADVEGTAYLAVTNLTGWPLTNYALGIKLVPVVCEPDEFEENDTPNAAYYLPMAPFQGSATEEINRINVSSVCTDEGSDEEDWFAVNLGPGDRIETFSFFKTASGGMDMSLYRLLSDGTAEGPVAADANILGARRIAYTLSDTAPAGTYGIQMTGLSTGGPGYIYTETTISRACADDALEPAPPSEVGSVSMPGFAGPADNILCSDEDWLDLAAADGQGSITVCIEASRLIKHHGLEVYAANSGTEQLPVGDAADLIGYSEAWRSDVQRVLIDRSGDTSAANYLLHIYQLLDVDEPAAATDYTLNILDGDVACP